MRNWALIFLSSVAVLFCVNEASARALGLVAAYSFEEGTGLTTADSSGNENIGTLSRGVRWTAGKIGKAVWFSGTGGEIIVNDAPSLNFTGSFTLAAWIQPAAQKGYQTILIKESTQGRCGYWLQTNGIQINSGFSNGFGCIEHQTTTANLDTGKWYHIASVLDRSNNTFKIYLNGDLILNVTEPATPVANSQSLVFGRSGSSESKYERWNGAIDEVRIYNRALSQGEIRAHMSTH
ncbi:MAG: LamG domain-containing protein [Acidobacteria bacterium]|nr:LamG domain-containing protein [Acidobacteriota bacterium]